MTSPAALHLLTPGSPGYALAKLGAIGGLVALRVAMSRRERRKAETADDQPAPAPPEPRASPHPVSRRKQARRRR